MSMRIIKIATRLRAKHAHTLIEFLDEVRDTLMQTHGPEIRAMLQHATTQQAGASEEDAPF